MRPEVESWIVPRRYGPSFMIGVETLDEHLINGHALLDDTSSEEHLEIIFDFFELCLVVAIAIRKATVVQHGQDAGDDGVGGGHDGDCRAAVEIHGADTCEGRADEELEEHSCPAKNRDDMKIEEELVPDRKSVV